MRVKDVVIEGIIGSKPECLTWQISSDKKSVELIYWNGDDKSLMDLCVLAPVELFELTLDETEPDIFVNEYYMSEFEKEVKYNLPEHSDKFELDHILSQFHTLFQSNYRRKQLTISTINE